MRRLLNQIKIQSQLSDQYAKPIIGFVSSYDPDNYCCKITVQPEDPVSESREIISGWIPVSTIWAGNGWGLFCPPAIGDKVEVDFQESDFEAGHVDWRFYDDDNRPIRAESGVFYIVHKNGAALKFENDGKASLQSKTELDLGDLSKTLHSFVTDAFQQIFNNHTHQIAGVQSGASTVVSAPTSTQMTSTHLTQVVKGN